MNESGHIGRRAFLKTGTIGAAAVSLSWRPAAVAQEGGGASAPIVLVHGAWHGGWCWKRVAVRLRAAGHEVYTPTLTGLGERAHLAGPGVNLETHITDLLSVMETEELSDVVLVGHSYAGMVITGVADRAGARLRSLVYLDAVVPDDGRSMIEYTAPERQNDMMKAGKATGFLNPPPIKLFGIADAADREWIERRMSRQPYPTFSQPLRFEHGGGPPLPRTYGYCSNPPFGPFDQFAKRFRNDTQWRFSELRTGHDCMITEPEAVARLVLKATGG